MTDDGPCATDVPAEFLTFRPFDGIVPGSRYVAFVDVLGFGGQILRDFDGAFRAYRALLDQWHAVWRHDPEVSLIIYSDALLMTAPSLALLTTAVNTLSFASLLNNALLRGGIAFGRHAEVRDSGNVYVVSEALTRAVEVEKHVGYPCVALHDSVDTPSDWWKLPNIARPVVYFEGVTFVNPFGAFWYRSSAGRVQVLKHRYPDYHDKHDWFLRLFFDGFEKDVPLVPPEFLS